MSFICKDAFFQLPVRKARAESEGGCCIHGLECCEDNGIASGGILNAVREGDVYKVDEE